MEEEGDLNQLIISIPKTTITKTKWTETEKHTQIYKDQTYFKINIKQSHK